METRQKVRDGAEECARRREGEKERRRGDGPCSCRVQRVVVGDSRYCRAALLAQARHTCHYPISTDAKAGKRRKGIEGGERGSTNKEERTSAVCVCRFSSRSTEACLLGRPCRVNASTEDHHDRRRYGLESRKGKDKGEQVKLNHLRSHSASSLQTPFSLQ